MNLGLRPKIFGRSPNREDSLNGRPKAFRTSAGIAGEFLSTCLRHASTPEACYRFIKEVRLPGRARRLILARAMIIATRQNPAGTYARDCSHRSRRGRFRLR